MPIYNWFHRWFCEHAKWFQGRWQSNWKEHGLIPAGPALDPASMSAFAEEIQVATRRAWTTAPQTFRILRGSIRDGSLKPRLVARPLQLRGNSVVSMVEQLDAGWCFGFWKPSLIFAFQHLLASKNKSGFGDGPLPQSKLPIWQRQIMMLICPHSTRQIERN